MAEVTRNMPLPGRGGGYNRLFGGRLVVGLSGYRKRVSEATRRIWQQETRGLAEMVNDYKGLI